MKHTNERRALIADEDVFERDGFKCVYCGFDGSTFEHWAFLAVDHLRPRHLGGGHEAENLRTACNVCNGMKGGATYATEEDARRALQTMWTQMRAYWECNVRHRVRSDQPE